MAMFGLIRMDSGNNTSIVDGVLDMQRNDQQQWKRKFGSYADGILRRQEYTGDRSPVLHHHIIASHIIISYHIISYGNKIMILGVVLNRTPKRVRAHGNL
jgi:hypothetical protein